MEADLILRSRRVVAKGEVTDRSIHVRNGRIESVSAWGDVPAGATIEDYGDDVIMPGIVDSHVHINEPGRTEWEGFSTATRAAAAGGITTIVDMPLNSVPPTTTAANLRIKRMAAEGKCHVDIGFWGGAIPGNAKELRAMLDAGALGFKCFMVESGVDEFPCVANDDLRDALCELAGTGAPLLCHAELAGPIEAAKKEIALLDIRTYASYLKSRPAESEIQAIELLIKLCRATGAAVHVVHLSAASALDSIRRARDEGLPLTIETTPHYLHFAAEEIPNGATAFKCAPPIRERDNREALWEGLKTGAIDLVVSDHSPCSPALKRIESGDFHAAWGGISSLELSLPVTWTDAKERGATIADIANWMCRAPAKLAGIDSKKGSIEPGHDADFVVWDPSADYRVDGGRLSHRHKLTPYAGESLKGQVLATYLRGKRIWGGGNHSSPRGRFLHR